MAHRYIALYQYGSNMDPKYLAKRLKCKVETLGMARLDRWGIRFNLYSKNKSNRCGVTNIVPSRREHALGVLYKLPYRVVIAPRGQRSAMDKIEGAGLMGKGNYKRKKIAVWQFTMRRKVEARTYTGTATGQQRFLRKPPEARRVSQAYFSRLLTGARRFSFPPSYIAYLRQQAGRLKRNGA